MEVTVSTHSSCDCSHAAVSKGHEGSHFWPSDNTYRCKYTEVEHDSGLIQMILPFLFLFLSFDLSVLLLLSSQKQAWCTKQTLNILLSVHLEADRSHLEPFIFCRPMQRVINMKESHVHM